MIQKRLFYGLSAVVALASALLLSGCGGGGSSAPTPGTLTGSAAVGSSAVSRVGRASVGKLQNQLNRIRPSQRSANLITRGRQGLDFDRELGLYYRYRSNATGVWIELFEDAAGERHAGEVVCKEDDSSYETIINIGTGAQQQRAYFRLTETNDSTRFKLRARYEDLRTDERTSIEGDLIIAPKGTPLDENEDDGGEDDGNGEDDWTDNFDWWENDGYCGDDYFGEDDEFFGEDDFFFCPDETDNPNFEDVDDFVAVRFEGTITYEGCGETVEIQGTLDYETGILEGEVAIGEDTTGSIECDYITNQGQMTLATPQGQVQIVFSGDLIEARYPDGRIERVNASQWADPCQGVGGGDNNQGGGGGGNQDGGGGDGNQGNLSLSSTAFANDGTIPLRYASTEVGGQSVSPPLSWSGAPSGTRSFVLVCLDPDANNFVHWVMYDIPASVNSLPEGVPPQATLPNGAKQGENDMGTIGTSDPNHPLASCIGMCSPCTRWRWTRLG
jgi:phosphatidylethanolamine-binding protein (PEBP) family uncharacterized protein